MPACTVWGVPQTVSSTAHPCPSWSIPPPARVSRSGGSSKHINWQRQGHSQGKQMRLSHAQAGVLMNPPCARGGRGRSLEQRLSRASDKEAALAAPADGTRGGCWLVGNWGAGNTWGAAGEHLGGQEGGWRAVLFMVPGWGFCLGWATPCQDTPGTRRSGSSFLEAGQRPRGDPSPPLSWGLV